MTKWRAAVRRSNYKPASGIPASGIPANPDSRGEGWGGPAKGAATFRPPMSEPFSADHRPNPQTPERKLFAKAKRERIAQLTDHLGHLALNAENEATQVSATIAALNRLEGMPVQRNINANVDDLDRLSDADLARIAGQGGGDTTSPEEDSPVVQ